MDAFFGYHLIQIFPVDQHKMTFIFPWGTFAYQKLPFGLINVRSTFQRAMSYAFHDIKNIVELYLDELLLIHNNRRTHGTLETFFLVSVIIIFDLIHTSLSSVFIPDVFLSLWFPKMASRLILWKLLIFWPYLPQKIWLNSKVCKGRKKNFIVLYVTS